MCWGNGNAGGNAEDGAGLGVKEWTMRLFKGQGKRGRGPELQHMGMVGMKDELRKIQEVRAGTLLARRGCSREVEQIFSGSI